MRTGLWLLPNRNFTSVLERRSITIPADETCSDASVFLHGICAVFALALHDRFGYGIYFATDESGDKDTATFPALFHCYCVDGDSESAIDVRGAIDDMEAFLEEFEDFFTDYAECYISRNDCERELLKMMSRDILNNCYAAACSYIDAHTSDFKI